jgi:hypothetical protein
MQGKIATAYIVLASLWIAYALLFLIVTMVHIERNHDQVNDKTYLDMYGALYTNVETYKKPRAAVHYTTIFLLRRLVMALCLVYLGSSNVMQTLVTVHASLVVLAWLSNTFPMASPYKNYLEMSNEFLICILGYFGFLFTNYVDDPVLRFKFGFVYIGIVAFGLLGNLLLLGSVSIRGLYLRCIYLKNQYPKMWLRFKRKFRISRRARKQPV